MKTVLDLPRERRSGDRARVVARPAKLSRVRFAIIATLVAAFLETACLVNDGFGYRLNVSSSMPLGIYRIEPGAVATRGTVVYTCESPEMNAIARERDYVPLGRCGPSFAAPVFKYVAGVGGDRVDVATGGVFVDGTILPDSAPLPHDHHGRRLTPASSRRLAFGQLWLYAPTSDAWDSRYFGPVAEHDVEVAIPVLTLGGAPGWR